MKIIKASIDFLDELTPLFDGYRVFYEQDSDIDLARQFLSERLYKRDSIIFLALDTNGNGLGFTQLYPTFSSVSMQSLYILNDLFVSNTARGMGVGAALLKHAQQFVRKEGAKGLVLETAIDNPAQKLYKRLGWVLDSEVNHYTWTA